LLPLALTAAGLPRPADRTLDGRDPTAVLAGKGKSPHEALFFEYGRFSGARVGNYKLVRPRPDAAFELYDLSTDIGETKELAAAKPAVVAELVRLRDQWMLAVRQP
jgi:arylsulfatase A-like enzyme